MDRESYQEQHTNDFIHTAFTGQEHAPEAAAEAVVYCPCTGKVWHGRLMEVPHLA